MDHTNFMISTHKLFPVIEGILSEGRQVRFTVSGNSMWPFIIHNRDSVLLTSCDANKLKKGTIILFQTEFGNYVLHRITKVVQDGYITTGDGNLHRDGFVSYDGVKAKVIKIYRKEKEISCDDWRWKIVFRIWMSAFPIRKYLQKLILRIHRKK